MVSLLGSSGFIVECVPGKSLVIIEKDSDEYDASKDDITFHETMIQHDDRKNRRVLHLMHGDLLLTPHIHGADIVMLETDFPQARIIAFVAYRIIKLISICITTYINCWLG